MKAVKIISVICILLVTLKIYSHLENSEEPTVSEEEAELLKDAVTLSEKSPGAAIEMLSAKRTGKSSAAIDFALATLFFQKGDLPAAGKAYGEALRKLPSFNRARANLARVLIQQDRLAEAEEVLKPVIMSGKAKPETLTLIGYTFLMKGESVPAESAYRQALLLKPDDISAYSGLAKCLIDQERYREAVRLLENILEKDPGNSQLWLLLVNANVAVGKADAAITKLECARYLKVASAEGMATLGDLYINKNQPRDALLAYREAFSSGKPSSGRMLRAAEGFVMLRSHRGAEEMIAKLGLSPELLSRRQTKRLHRLRAYLSYLKGDRKEAIASYRKLLEEDPLDVDALLALGDLYREECKLEEAVISYERASHIKGKEAEALVRQAQVEVERERYSKAVELLESALVFAHKKSVAKYLEQVRRLAKSRF
jgi:tetratricopeptide (TPR) repeat protein